MPLIDMPLEELKTYMGISPEPDDIDTFWDKALAEMKAADPQISIEESEFKAPYAECYDMTFTGMGGARIYAKLIKPIIPKGKSPAVIKFHGYTMDSGDWIALLPYAAAGFTVASMDCRGQGGKSEDVGGVRGNTLHGHIIRGLEEGPEKLLYRSIFCDAAQLAGIVMDMDDVEEKRVGCYGGSQGGALALACASLEPRINRVASIEPFLSDYRRVWDMDLDKKAYQEIQDWFRRFDPTHEREDEFFRTLSYIDVKNIVHRIDGELLMLTGLMDDMCPPSAQFAAYNHVTSKKDMVLFPDFGHEELPRAYDRVFRFMMGML